MTAKITIHPAEPHMHPLLTDMQERMAIETEQRALQPHLISEGIRRALESPQGTGANLFVAKMRRADVIKFINSEEDSGTAGQAYLEELDQQNAALGYEPKRGQEEEGEEDVVVAMMMSTREFDLLRCGNVTWFQSVYVRPRFRRQGIFRSFFIFNKLMAESDLDTVALRLDVDCTNERAQATYERMGMHREQWSVFRWTLPGRDCVPVDAVTGKAVLPEPEAIAAQMAEVEKKHSGDDNNAAAISSSKHLTAEELELISNSLTVRAATAQDSCEHLVRMHCASAKTWSRYPEQFISEELVAKSVRRLTAPERQLPDQLIVVELKSSASSSTETLVGSALLTFEHSDWRNSAVVNLQNFAVAPEFNSIRRAVFVAVYRYIRARAVASMKEESNIKAVLSPSTGNSGGLGVLGGIRVPCVLDAEREVSGTLPSMRIDEVMVDADECAMSQERYYWMRYNIVVLAYFVTR